MEFLTDKSIFDLSKWEWIAKKQKGTLSEWLLPSVAVLLYLISIKLIPPFVDRYYPNGVSCKRIIILWNIILANFSVLGSMFVIPYTGMLVFRDGFHNSVCARSDSHFNGRVGFFMLVFVYSKYLELIDTVWLMIKKKKIIFLQWFHHSTVLLFCWYGMLVRSAAGLYFAGINFFVHSIMYSYFALSQIGGPFYKRIKPYRRYITVIQSSQMVIGLFITLYVALHENENCPGSDKTHAIAGALMYASYLYLFVILLLKIKSPLPKQD